jgi:serine/threonine-protein kinase
MVLGRRTDDDTVVDVVKVCDFGIAKLVEAEEPGDASKGGGKLTTAGLVIGTPAYMSPEQGRGEQIDGRSDLYSMGVILFQLLTGQLPFDAPSPIGIVVKHQSEPVPIPSTIRPGVSKELEAICLRALAKAPADRFQTAKELRAALRHVSDAGILLHDPSVASAASLPVVRTGSGRFVTGGLAGGGETAETQAMVATTAPAPVVTAPALVTAPGGVPAARTSRLFLPGGAVALVVGVGLFLGLRQHGASSHEPAPRTDSRLDTEPRIAMLSEPPPRYVAPEPSSPPAPSATVPSNVSPQVHERATPKAEPYVRGPARTPPVDPVRSADPPKKDESPSMPVPAPSVVAPPPPPPLPVTPPPATPPPSFELALASVAVGSPSNLTHTSGTAVSAALAHMKPAITSCYKSALPSLSAPLEGAGTLHIETDDEGNITRAQLTGPVRGQAGSCIEGVVRGVTIRGVEFKAR